MTKKKRPTGEAVAEFAMAHGSMERTESDVARGRRYAAQTDEQLNGLFVQAMKARADDPSNQDTSSLYNDITSEYAMRSIEPPFALVKTEFEKVIQAAIQTLEDMDDDQQREINAQMLEEYTSARKREN